MHKDEARNRYTRSWCTKTRNEIQTRFSHRNREGFEGVGLHYSDIGSQRGEWVRRYFGFCRLQQTTRILSELKHAKKQCSVHAEMTRKAKDFKTSEVSQVFSPKNECVQMPRGQKWHIFPRAVGSEIMSRQ